MTALARSKNPRQPLDAPLLFDCDAIRFQPRRRHAVSSGRDAQRQRALPQAVGRNHVPFVHGHGRRSSIAPRGRANALRLAPPGALPPDQLTDRRMYDTFDLCLQCKGCKAECPSNVDVAKLKAEFLSLSFTVMVRQPRLEFGFRVVTERDRDGPSRRGWRRRRSCSSRPVLWRNKPCRRWRRSCAERRRWRPALRCACSVLTM